MDRGFAVLPFNSWSSLACEAPHVGDVELDAVATALSDLKKKAARALGMSEEDLDSTLRRKRAWLDSVRPRPTRSPSNELELHKRQLDAQRRELVRSIRRVAKRI